MKQQYKFTIDDQFEVTSIYIDYFDEDSFLFWISIVTFDCSNNL